MGLCSQTNQNQPFINEMKKLDTGRMSIVEPLVYVVLQKYGILNRNGRIYPESVLKSKTNFTNRQLENVELWGN
jgi:hypothetical protein